MVSVGQRAINAEIRSREDLPKHIKALMLDVVGAWSLGLAGSLTGIQLAWKRGVQSGEEVEDERIP